jgi:hypothetical protein
MHAAASAHASRLRGDEAELTLPLPLPLLPITSLLEMDLEAAALLGRLLLPLPAPALPSPPRTDKRPWA